MPSELITVTLFRESESEDWGFSISGGVDVDEPLIISDVSETKYYFSQFTHHFYNMHKNVLLNNLILLDFMKSLKIPHLQIELYFWY